jgi:hypothetical protein
MRPELKQILNDELKDLQKRIIQNHIKAGQKASGKTIKSITVEIGENYGQLTGRKFFGTLETGRKAGRVPAKFQDVILKWMQDKGINVPKPKSFAYLVARKIRLEGTLLYRTGGRSDIYSKEISITIERLTKRLGQDQVAEISRMFDNLKVVV